MFSSKNTQMNERKNRSKVTRYAIKKLSMGTASVAVALGFLLVQGQSVVLADTVETTQSATETKAGEMSEKVEATTEEPTTTSEEQAPRTRTRREAGDAPVATSPVGADVEDATATPKVTKPGFTKELSQEELLSQASWIDFGDVANWSGTTTSSTGQLALQEGSTYTKEISPGYVVTVRVKSLKPFNATEIYKKRLEAQGTTAAEKNTYDPNAKNGYMNSSESADGKREFNAGKEALIVGEPQDAWSEIYNSGIDTGEKRTTITTQYEGGNVGVQFEITGTYKGKTVKPTVLMTEGDSSNLGELSLYTTNGTGWQHFAEWYKYDSPYTLNYFPQDTKDLFDPNKKVIGFRPLPINGVNYHSGELAAIREATQVGPDKKPVAWKYYGSPDQKTGGLGTGVFGPNLSAGMVAVPIVMTQGATEVSLYMASASKQSAMIGFLPFDGSDAPESYGKATHSINQVHNVTGEDVKQPYLGDTRPDVDENVDRTNWKGDDAEGSADEGIDQILPADLKGKTNGILVLDRTNKGDLTLSVEAHTGGAAEATLYGWVDFNGNGTFDEDERSEKLSITADGTATLVFKDAFKKVNVALSELGARVRIAKDATQIEKPTGMALSGEVEDFEVHLTFLPRGSKTETDGLQGIPQTGTVVFTPSGKQRYSLTDDAVIDEAIEPVIIDETGAKVALDAEVYYVVAGEGKYKVTGTGKDVTVEFIPEAGFVGTGKGITFRRTDNNGNDTGWTPVSANEKIVSDQTNTMDGRYIPTVVPMSKELTSTKVQGIVHVETPKFEGKDGAVTPSSEKPMVLVDPTTGKALGASAPAMKDGKEVGTYTVDETTGKVTFTPNKDFTGTAEPIVVQVIEKATGKAIAGLKYTPTVTPVTPTGEDVTTTGKQGKVQRGTPKFTEGDAEVPLKVDADQPAKFIVNGTAVEDTTIDATKDGAKVGKYTLDPLTGEVTFTPNKDFVGTPDAATVQVKDENGTVATATYTPTVTAVTPTGEDATSTGKQGKVQTGTPKFTEGDAEVPLKVDADQPAKFIVNGTAVEDTTIDATKDGAKVGKYTLDPLTGEVTFTPNKDFVGTPDAVTVQVKDENGTATTAKYTPTVTAVTPTGEDATSTGKQGKIQTGTPKFTEGDAEVPLKVDADQPAKFVVNGTAVDDTTIDAMKDGAKVGTYTINPLTGEVTFTPNRDFVGTPDAATVQGKDENGISATAKYIPTVTSVTPTGEDAASTGKQGKVQIGTPKFTEGDVEVPLKVDADQPAKFVVNGTAVEKTKIDATKDGAKVGTYAINPLTGEVTFTPNKDFSGTLDAVTVQVRDENGTTATAKYTPTVTAVTPTGEDVTTTGKQGKVQTGTPKFTEGDAEVPLKVDADQPAKFVVNGTAVEETTIDAMKDGAKIGTYAINPLTGEVTFTPNKDFVGTPDAATVQVKDENGTAAKAKYMPTVTAVTPTGEDATSTGKQGKGQTGTPKFTEGDAEVPLKVDADQPAKFVVNGTAVDDTTIDAVKNGAKVGTYAIDPLTGEVIFTPNKDFVGTPDAVTVQVKDENGTATTAKYTPTVTAVTPTGEDATSTGKQGKVQTGTPKFTEGDVEVPLKVDADQPAKFVVNETEVEETTIDATKDDAKVGTYTINPLTGEVTFTPNKDFVGTPDAATVQVKDENGTAVTAKYTPTVTAVTPTGEDVTSTDVQGKAQTAKPTFTEGDAEVPLDDRVPVTFEDGTTEKVIAGVGTFTVAADGTITFVPEASFTGETPAVTIQRVDMNGTVAKASYTATVTPAPVDPVKPEEPTKPENPAQPEEPAKPVEPAEPAKPVEPEKPVVTDPQQTVVAPAVVKTTQTELPNTGTTDEFAIFNAAALSILASLGLVATSRKKEEA